MGQVSYPKGCWTPQSIQIGLRVLMEASVKHQGSCMVGHEAFHSRGGRLEKGGRHPKCGLFGLMHYAECSIKSNGHGVWMTWGKFKTSVGLLWPLMGPRGGCRSTTFGQIPPVRWIYISRHNHEPKTLIWPSFTWMIIQAKSQRGVSPQSLPLKAHAHKLVWKSPHSGRTVTKTMSHLLVPSWHVVP